MLTDPHPPRPFTFCGGGDAGGWLWKRFIGMCASRSTTLWTNACYLRADPRFDDLVCKLLGGDVERFEEIQSEAVAQINKNFNRDALQRSIEDGLKRQLLARKREEYALRKKRKLTVSPPPSTNAQCVVGGVATSRSGQQCVVGNST